MYCYYHPDRPSVAQCVVCGKTLCTECTVIKEGQNYCKNCLGIHEVHVDIGKIVLPALGCGALAGILSIAPMLSALNCVFCLWIVLGGGLAVYIMKRYYNIPGKISFGKAALTGGFAGFVASLIMSAALLFGKDINTAIEEAMRNPETQQALRDAGLAAGDIAGVVMVFVAIIIVVLFTLFGALGGIISNELTK